MRINGQHWFPYVPPSWLERLVELIRRSVPQRIDAEWCLEAGRFSFTANNASQFLSQIRTLGWIDEDGRLTEPGRNLRLDGSPYEQFMRDEVARIYDELAEQLGTPGFGRDAANTYFTAASRLGISGRRQVISALRWFLTQAGMTEAAERMGGSTSPPRPRVRRAAGEGPPRTRPSRTAGQMNRGKVGGPGVALGGITLNISLQLPAVDDERVYQAIFKAMREHLFGSSD